MAAAVRSLRGHLSRSRKILTRPGEEIILDIQPTVVPPLEGFARQSNVEIVKWARAFAGRNRRALEQTLQMRILGVREFEHINGTGCVLLLLEWLLC